MNDITEIVQEVSADRDWRGIDWDQVYARPELTDDALTAAVWAAAKFHATFPGWQLYRRAAAGMTLFDDELDAWVVGGARLLARARKTNGRSYVEARGPWIDQAARDALAFVIHGVAPASARSRGDEFGIKRDTWLKIYRPLCASIQIGLDTFRSELHAEYRRVKMATPENHVTLKWEGRELARNVDFQSGNNLTPSAPDSDTLHADPWPDVLK